MIEKNIFKKYDYNLIKKNNFKNNIQKLEISKKKFFNF
jgi:hypothetical protein